MPCPACLPDDILDWTLSFHISEELHHPARPKRYFSQFINGAFAFLSAACLLQLIVKTIAFSSPAAAAAGQPIVGFVSRQSCVLFPQKTHENALERAPAAASLC